MTTQDNSHIKSRIEGLIKPYENLPLECDGYTRLINFVLNDNAIPHTVYVGEFVYKNPSGIHFWITVDGTNLTIDYAIRNWLRVWDDEQIPHGVFIQSKYPLTYYDSHGTIEINTSKDLASILLLTCSDKVRQVFNIKLSKRTPITKVMPEIVRERNFIGKMPKAEELEVRLVVG